MTTRKGRWEDEQVAAENVPTRAHIDEPGAITPANHLANVPPLEYLLTCSIQSLQDIELASLSRAANHLKTAKLEWEQAAAHKETAGAARWLIEHRDELLGQTSRTLEVRPVEEFPRLTGVSGPAKGIDALLGQKPTEK